MVALCTSFYIITISNVIRWWGPRRRHLHRTTFSMKHLYPLSFFSHQRCFMTLVDRLYSVFSPDVWNNRFRMAVSIGLSSLHCYFALMFFKKRSRLGWSVWCDDYYFSSTTDLILAHVSCVTTRLSNLNEKRKAVCITLGIYCSAIYVLVFSTHVWGVFLSSPFSHSFQRKFSSLSMNDDATLTSSFDSFLRSSTFLNSISFLPKLLSRCL